MISSVGIAGANAWLDTNVLSPRIRSWLGKSRRTGRRTDFGFLVSRVLAVTRNARTTILAPEPLRAQVGAGGWRRVAEHLILLLELFDTGLDQRGVVVCDRIEGLHLFHPLAQPRPKTG